MASYTFSNGETGYGIILNDGDQMEIRNGGFAENTGVTVGGKLTVLNGGLADTVHLDGGTLEVLTGVTAANVYFTWTIDEDSEVTIRVDGGEINGLAGETITSWWYKTMSIRITDDGVLRNANFEQYYPDDGFLVLSNGGTLEDSRLNNFSLTVSEGGIVQSTELRAWDRTHSILNSGLFVDVSFFGGEQGVLNIYDGGRAVRTSVESGTIVLSGGRASETRLGEKGVLLLSSGGLADATTILKGEMHVLSGGTATGAILPGEYNRWGGGGIDSIGPMHISEGGLGLGTKIAGVGHHRQV